MTKLPPGPRGLPLAGHAPWFLRDKLGFLTRAAREYGDVALLQLGGPTYLLNDPADIRHVLVGNAHAYEKSPRVVGASGRHFTGDTLLSRSWADHRARRRLMQPVLRVDAREDFGQIVASQTREMVAGWSDGEAVDIRAAMLRLAKTSISQTLFGPGFEDPNRSWERAIEARSRSFEQLLNVGAPSPRSLVSRGSRSPEHVNGAISTVVDRELGKLATRSTECPSLLGALAGARYADGTPMGETEVRAEAVALALSGFEANAPALAWTCYLLSRHPDVQARLRDEALAIEAAELSSEHLEALPFAHATVAESLRLYPPTWLMVRVAIEDDVLTSGFDVPCGTKIYLSQWVTHRDCRYFREPDQFLPRRFLEENSDARARMTFFPFGAGPRACIGEGLATAENVVAIATIMREWELSPVDQREIKPYPGIALRPREPIKLIAKRR